MPKITVEAKKENLPQVTDFIHSFLKNNNVPQKTIMQTELAAEEIFINIASYAYAPESGTAEISCSVNSEKKQFSISFKDFGTPFNPLEKPDPDVTLSAEQRKIGGLGIFITKQYMDNIEYTFQDCNILKITKKFQA